MMFWTARVRFPPPPIDNIKLYDMKEMTEITCAYCGKKSLKPLKEIERQKRKGQKLFFCSLSCVAKYKNSDKKKPVVKKICPVCGKEFETSTRKKLNKTYCSRSCASKGSVTDYRRLKAKETGQKLQQAFQGNVAKVKDMMLKREKEKYSLLKEYLCSNLISHDFEFILEDKLYDLALTERKILIEFDGKDHQIKKGGCFENDRVKDQIALNNGWRIERVQVESGELIPVSKIQEFLN